jgi:hypothetical protein
MSAQKEKTMDMLRLKEIFEDYSELTIDEIDPNWGASNELEGLDLNFKPDHRYLSEEYWPLAA